MNRAADPIGCDGDARRREIAFVAAESDGMIDAAARRCGGAATHRGAWWQFVPDSRQTPFRVCQPRISTRWAVAARASCTIHAESNPWLERLRSAPGTSNIDRGDRRLT